MLSSEISRNGIDTVDWPQVHIQQRLGLVEGLSWRRQVTAGRIAAPYDAFSHCSNQVRVRQLLSTRSERTWNKTEAWLIIKCLC